MVSIVAFNSTDKVFEEAARRSVSNDVQNNNVVSALTYVFSVPVAYTVFKHQCKKKSFFTRAFLNVPFCVSMCLILFLPLYKSYAFLSPLPLLSSQLLMRLYYSK